MAIVQQNDHSPDTATLYAWLSRDADGIEGIISWPIGNAIVALVATDEARARRLARFAQVAAQQRGFPAQLVAFERAGDPLQEVR